MNAYERTKKAREKIVKEGGRVITIMLPAPLSQKLNEIVKKGAFTNYSDAIRQLIREVKL